MVKILQMRWGLENNVYSFSSSTPIHNNKITHFSEFSGPGIRIHNTQTYKEFGIQFSCRWRLGESILCVACIWQTSKLTTILLIGSLNAWISLSATKLFYDTHTVTSESVLNLRSWTKMESKLTKTTSYINIKWKNTKIA